ALHGLCPGLRNERVTIQPRFLDFAFAVNLLPHLRISLDFMILMGWIQRLAEWRPGFGEGRPAPNPHERHLLSEWRWAAGWPDLSGTIPGYHRPFGGSAEECLRWLRRFRV